MSETRTLTTKASSPATDQQSSIAPIPLSAIATSSRSAESVWWTLIKAQTSNPRAGGDTIAV